MSTRKPVKLSTTNVQPSMKAFFNNEKGNGLDIEVTCKGSVSETLEEASEWYGGEDKLIKSIQADQLRRLANAARPLLRDADQVGDWQAIAQSAIDSYTPGQRGGRSTPTVDQQELEQAQAGGMDAMLAYLRGRGIVIAPQAGEQEEEEVEGAGDEDLSDEDLEALTSPEADLNQNDLVPSNQG